MRITPRLRHGGRDFTPVNGSFERRQSNRDGSDGTLVNAAWIALGIGLAVAVAALAKSWVRRYQGVDLGTVSDQWMAQQRLGLKEHDPQH